MVSATGSQVSDGVSNDSFCTDEDMRESGKPEGKSLLTIKEESGNENESTLKRSARAQVLTESVLSSQLDSVAEGLGKSSHKNASVADGKANGEPGSGHTSINASQSYREKPVITIVSEADQLIAEENQNKSHLTKVTESSNDLVVKSIESDGLT